MLAFFAAGLWAAWRDLDRRGAAAVALTAFGVGLGFDLASTRWSVPFGGYTYTTGAEELHIGNVPLFTPLSYVFLGWISLGAARWAGRLWLAPVVFTWIDVVVDPVTVRGREWFLGEVFRYHSDGQYFGVPLSNFGGWLLLGTAITVAYGLAPTHSEDRRGPRSLAVVAGVLAFALGVTASIGEWALLACGAAWSLGLLGLLLLLRSRAAFDVGALR